MFEIGNSLREARLRQGRDYARAEADTKIRGRYLQALEDERFDVFPGEAYVKGFLRTYAEYLGLDGQLYVDEFNSRFSSTEDAAPPARPAPRPRGRRESSFVLVALAGIVAVAVLVVVAFAFSNNTSPKPSANLGAEETSTAGQRAAAGEETKPAGERKKRRVANLVLTAARGDCWVEVHAGSAAGEIVFSGTIFEGQSERFRGKRLLLVFGDAPAENLDVRLNGKVVRRFPVNADVVVVTPTGARAQA